MDHEALYVTSAQVIPLLLIAWVVQLRFGQVSATLRESKHDRIRVSVFLALTCGVVILAMVGEVVSVGSLMSKTDSDVRRRIVSDAVLITALGVSGALLLGHVHGFIRRALSNDSAIGVLEVLIPVLGIVVIAVAGYLAAS